MAQPKDLLEHVDFQSLECLNQDPSHTIANALKQGYREDDGLFLQSSEDCELLINIPFNQKVKIQSITFKGPQDCGPKVVKLFVNRATMGFSDVTSVPAAQELELSADQVSAGEPIALKYVKFQNVTMLSVFIESNQDDEDITKLQKIALFGQSGEVFNVADIKKQDEKK